MSLSSPSKGISSVDIGRNHSSDSQSDDDDATKSTEESSESEEEYSDGSSLNKTSSENQSGYYEQRNDDGIKARSTKGASKKMTATYLEPEKRAAPVPQVRFSKLLTNMKK